MADLLFYTKRSCGLCARLREMIRRQADELALDDLRLVEIDIEQDAAAAAQYRTRIPVVMVGNAVLLEGRPDEQEVRQAMEALE